MTNPHLRVLLFALALSGTMPLAAQDLPPIQNDVFTGPEHEFVPHPFDQQHIVVDVRIDPVERTVTGFTELHVRPLEPMQRIRLMAADMVVDSVVVSTGSRSFLAPFMQSGVDSLVVTLSVPDVERDSSASMGMGLLVGSPADSLAASPADSALADRIRPAGADTVAADTSDVASEPVAATDSLESAGLDEPFVVTTYFAARPTVGLYFVPPYEDEEAELVQVWSQGEAEGNRHWFPLFDVPGDKLTSEVVVTIDSAYTVVSNGTLQSDLLNEDGTRTVHFSQTRPHSPYLISIAADDYVSIRGHATLSDGTRIPLAYHVLPERQADVQRTLGATPEIIAYFSEILGVPYPWAKYDQVFVRDFMWGGMENTGATTLTARSLIDERAALDYTPENVVAHEIAHQWFGDLVTVQYWPHSWLHEGLTTYLEALNTERSRGREDFLLEMQENFDGYLREARDYVRPIVWNRWVAPMDVFDAHLFGKGPWVAHMLREQVGDETFFAILERFLESNAHQAVTTDDLQDAAESVTGADYDAFFEQWLYSAGHPELEIRPTYDASTGRLRVVVRQTQEGGLVPQAFRFPLEIEIQTLGGAERYEVEITEREHDFTFEVDMAPRFVLPNPDLSVMADIHVEQPAAAWVAQLRYALEPVSRLLAARELARFVDEPALLVGLKSAFDVEQHPDVRREIVRTIALLPNDPAKERVLLAATQDAKAGVRAAAVSALGGFSGSEAVASRLFEVAQNEVSYGVQAAAVLALARAGAASAEEVFRSALITPSHRERIRRAAFRALPHLDVSAAEGYRIAAEYSAFGQPTEARIAAIEYLGSVASEQDRALDRLIALLADDAFRVREATVTALSKSDDPRALEALEERLSAEPEDKIRRQIRRTVQQWAVSFGE